MLKSDSSGVVSVWRDDHLNFVIPAFLFLRIEKDRFTFLNWDFEILVVYLFMGDFSLGAFL